ncbi:NUDIX domain-containing protein [Amycolatopsis endophytica]|uniref:8-oxo-dGTP pyrophosphatase MutT (NUDIX family) n=1 Tax=Amycolatopsis endophytica TaxID=860233 RepID=A0A853B5H1_9PSEU|nr:NUDIX domain-containing protein [Amycolatopsis endophytica]NYI90052.1 8-oxo-dGTP pyrophosphatase MutT (NUDIX family) [Amycolatopsis endophytica]
MIDKVAWLRVENGRVLAARSHGKTAWYLPGGKREPGETDAETLAREVAEELAVEITPGSAELTLTVETEADGQPQLLRMACYTAAYTGTITPSAEIAEVAWLGYADRTRGSQAFRLVLDELHSRGELH